MLTFSFWIHGSPPLVRHCPVPSKINWPKLSISQLKLPPYEPMMQFKLLCTYLLSARDQYPDKSRDYNSLLSYPLNRDPTRLLSTHQRSCSVKYFQKPSNYYHRLEQSYLRLLAPWLREILEHRNPVVHILAMHLLAGRKLMRTWQ
ncbi:hypothetical protein OnM2_006015 [Erysiphe neolycopersici]|uniref:Uncharacterized protein n=1 Tax=Erysiphe neolycopersici TaxID=212602 RepID=A0A420I771_9PEZI|nr:hypothetical protein OnM2_006015 [Erysiphe neolycopersici]